MNSFKQHVVSSCKITSESLLNKLKVQGRQLTSSSDFDDSDTFKLSISEQISTGSSQSSQFINYIDTNQNFNTQNKTDNQKLNIQNKSEKSRGYNSTKDDFLANKESPLKHNLISVDSTKSSTKKSNHLDETQDRSSNKV